QVGRSQPLRPLLALCLWKRSLRPQGTCVRVIAKPTVFSAQVEPAESRVRSRLIRAAPCESSICDGKHWFHTAPSVVGRALGCTSALPHRDAHESAPEPRPRSPRESPSPRWAKVPHPAARIRPTPTQRKPSLSVEPSLVDVSFGQ